MVHLNKHKINITMDCKHENIPVITYFFVVSKEKEKFGPQFWSSLNNSDIGKLDSFGDSITRGISNYLPIGRRLKN